VLPAYRAKQGDVLAVMPDARLPFFVPDKLRVQTVDGDGECLFRTGVWRRGQAAAEELAAAKRLRRLSVAELRRLLDSDHAAAVAQATDVAPRTLEEYLAALESSAETGFGESLSCISTVQRRPVLMFEATGPGACKVLVITGLERFSEAVLPLYVLWRRGSTGSELLNHYDLLQPL